MIEEQIFKLAMQLGKELKQKGIMIATAESCTGGGIAQAITDILGSSAWFDRGFVTYSNTAKLQMLQVNQKSLDKQGAVSKKVAIEMVEGALINSNADIAVSVTGIAGPAGGTEQKPVGTVYIAWKIKGEIAKCTKENLSGNRSQIRQQTIRLAIKGCLEIMDGLLSNSCSMYQKSEDFLKELLKEKLPEQSHFFLFGSRAIGNHGEMADIDIGIQAESEVSINIINALKETIEESFVPYDVDIVDFEKVSEEFKQQALKKVIPWN